MNILASLCQIGILSHSPVPTFAEVEEGYESIVSELLRQYSFTIDLIVVSNWDLC